MFVATDASQRTEKATKNMMTQFNQADRIRRGTKIVVAALALSGCTYSTLYAENLTGMGLGLTTAVERNFACYWASKDETARVASLVEAAAFPHLPKVSVYNSGLARQVAIVSFARRICRLLRAQAVPLAVTAALERAVSYIEKHISSDQVRRAFCYELSSLRNGIARNELIKPEARAEIGELLAELQHLSRCASLSPQPRTTADR